MATVTKIASEVSIMAAILSGCQYRHEMTQKDLARARDGGLVVVFGANDDLMEFRGAINDQAGCYGEGERLVLIDCDGPLPSVESLLYQRNVPGLREYFRREADARKITAKWDSDGYTWTYETDIPHATFDVVEGGERYCRGIVFRLADITKIGERECQDRERTK